MIRRNGRGERVELPRTAGVAAAPIDADTYAFDENLVDPGGNTRNPINQGIYVDLPILICIYMRQKGFLFFKIFNKIFVNHEQDHPTFDWSISSFTCLYDTLDNATAAYTAIHE